MAAIEPVPWNTPTLVEKPWLGNQSWLLWFDSVRAALARVAVVVATYSTSAVQAATAPVGIYTPTETGFYRVSINVRVTQVATTSSSVQVFVYWTAGGVIQTRSGTLLNGNTLTTQETFDVVMEADGATAIVVEATYASVGATPMQYRLAAFVEAMPS